MLNLYTDVDEDTDEEVLIMATLTKKTQILFSEEQLELLKKIAEEKATSMGALVREAVEKVYLKGIKRERRDIAKRLISMQLPVDEWEKMEKEITGGAMEGR